MTHEALTSCGASLTTPRPLTNVPRQAGTAAWDSGAGFHILGISFSQILEKSEAHPESIGCEASLEKKKEKTHPLGIFYWPENCGTAQ